MRRRTARRGLVMAVFALVEGAVLLAAVMVARSGSLPAPALVAVVGLLAGVGGLFFLLMMFTVMRPEAADRSARRPIAAGHGGAADPSAALELLRSNESPRARRSRNALERLARELGFTYTHKASRTQRKSLSKLTKLPEATDIRHILHGELAGAAVTCLQHTYVVSTGQATIPVVTTALLAQAPASWPEVRITPASPLHRLARSVGLSRSLKLDLDAFNQAFVVRSEDEEFALLLLTPAVQELLLTAPTKLRWRIGQGAIRAHARGKMQAKKLTAQLEALQGFLERIPSELHTWPGEAV